MFAASEEWKARYPDACFGVLIMEGVDNTGKCPALEERKDALEQSLRTLYAGKSRKEIGAEHPFASYGRYYKAFGKNYHVLFQVESVALKEKPIFSPSPLVAVMFMAELKNGLLTAGHDLDRTEPPFLLDVAKGEKPLLHWGERNVLFLRRTCSSPIGTAFSQASSTAPTIAAPLLRRPPARSSRCTERRLFPQEKCARTLRRSRNLCIS